MKWDDYYEEIKKKIYAKLPQYEPEHIDIISPLACTSFYKGTDKDYENANQYMPMILVVILKPGIDYGKVHLWSFKRLIKEEVIKE